MRRAPRYPRLDRAGMTLIELVVSLVLAGLVLGTALTFALQQEQAFDMGAGRMSSLQNYRFAADLMEANLRTVGSGVPASQPFLVYLDDDVLAFNADYSTNDPEDPFAVYVDPDATTDEVNALPRARQAAIPNTDFVYPDTTYTTEGLPSTAETIVFFLRADGDTPREDDHVLYRQVNDLEPEVVARHLLRTPGRPFFEYLEEVRTDSTAPVSRWVPRRDLPLVHTRRLHLEPGDTGRVARIDRVRAVRVSFTSTSGQPDELEQSREIERVIRFPNAGLAVLKTCGDPPQFTSAVTADTTTGVPQVQLRWSRSADDGQGQDDVIRYVVFRRAAGEAEWGTPYASTTGGTADYLYVDSAVEPDSSYTYAVAAQDCTPSMSQLRPSNTIRVPVLPPAPPTPPSP